jgi:hypothetical protein
MQVDQEMLFEIILVRHIRLRFPIPTSRAP